MHISASGRVGFNWLVDYINELQCNSFPVYCPRQASTSPEEKLSIAQVLPSIAQVSPKNYQVLTSIAHGGQVHFPRVKTAS